ncbi:MAG: hypothetical protein HKN47_12520 [Pirellulaceae bacterium]|nr:hypothetical protein [Pirellulaceae bacterium]
MIYPNPLQVRVITSLTRLECPDVGVMDHGEGKIGVRLLAAYRKEKAYVMAAARTVPGVTAVSVHET